MRLKWLLPILMLVLALVVVACGPDDGPVGEPGIEAPTAVPGTDGEGTDLGVAEETASPEAEMTAAVTPEVEATEAMTAEVEATDSVTTEVDATAAVTPEVEPTEAMTVEVEATDALTSEIGGESGINEVTFIGTEYAFEGPASVPAGWTRFTFENQGELPHDLQPVYLEEGRTLSDVMTALAGEGPPDWVKLYGGVSAQPGETESFLVDLEPGNYVLISFGEAESGLPDAAQGMIAELTVTETDTVAADVELPEADAEINMVDFAFNVEDEIQSGEQLLYVTNTGTELHELIVFRLKEGRTMEDVQAVLEQEMAGEQIAEEDLPMDFFYGTQLSPGVEMYATQDFEPGIYVFICFIPSPENDMTPHYELGMIDQVVVE